VFLGLRLAKACPVGLEERKTAIVYFQYHAHYSDHETPVFTSRVSDWPKATFESKLIVS